MDDRRVRGADGNEVGVRLYLPAGTRSGAALCWLHGGGHVMGDVAQDDPLLCATVAATGCVAVSVDWRHSPEHPYPAALDDAYAALTWMAGAEDLALDPERIVIAGASSGGGLAAGLALLARDRAEIRPSAQVLIYPMLDDRPRSDPGRGVTDRRVWNEESNRIAWGHYLRALVGDVPAYAAPSRATDLSGLPPTWMATGALDLFVDEDLDYAHRLLRSRVPVELHVYPGAIHGFDVFAPDATVSRRYAAERDAALVRLLT